MKIAFLLPQYYSYPIGGYRVVYAYANYLASAGHDVTVIFPRSLVPNSRLGPLDRVRARLWPTKLRIQNRPLVAWVKLDPRVRIKLAGLLTEDVVPEGDAVVATAWQTAEFVNSLGPDKGRKLYLVQDHEVWHGVDPQSVNATFSLGFRVIAVSTWLGRLAETHGATDVRVIKNGLDQNTFTITEAPEKRSPGILALFHHDPRKDVQTTLRALASIHNTRPDIPITMFGVPERDPQIPTWITYVRAPSQSQLVSLYNSHTIFISSSQVEGWCLPAAEAMACGCTFIGTDSLGPRDFCQHGVTGLLSEVGDANALAANVCDMLDNPETCRQMQAAGTEFIQQFTWDRAGASFLQALID